MDPEPAQLPVTFLTSSDKKSATTMAAANHAIANATFPEVQLEETETLAVMANKDRVESLGHRENMEMMVQLVLLVPKDLQGHVDRVECRVCLLQPENQVHLEATVLMEILVLSVLKAQPVPQENKAIEASQAIPASTAIEAETDLTANEANKERKVSEVCQAMSC